MTIFDDEFIIKSICIILIKKGQLKIMFMDNFYKNNFNKFQYFIIMPRNLVSNDTFFNKFDNNIIKSVIILKFISHLPSTWDDYFDEWPSMRNIYEDDSEYSIKYIYEDNIKEKILEIFSGVSLGCIFLLDKIQEELVSEIEILSRMPIVGNGYKKHKKVIPLDQKAVKIVYEKLNEARRDIYEKTNEDMFSKECMRYNGNKTDIPSYVAPSIKFINPLTATINRMRGLYERIGDGQYQSDILTPDNHLFKESEADREIYKALRQLISEKYLILNLGYSKENIIDDISEFFLNEVGIDKEQLKDFLKSKDTEVYLGLVSKIIKNFNKLNFLTDMVLCVPSVNYKLMKWFTDSDKEQILPDEILKIFYDSGDYYYIVNNIKQYSIEIQYLMEERSDENYILSEVYLLYALGKCLPYIRTRNIPTSQIYIIASNLSEYALCFEENETISNFNKEIKAIANKIEMHVNKGKKNILNILKSHGNRIKIFSDLPVEWIMLDNLPLCLSKKVSRIPITPGNGIFNHSNYIGNNHSITKEKLRVLIINALNPTDNIYNVGRSLYKQVDAYFSLLEKKVDYIEVCKKEAFMEAIQKYKPTILIYYGHGEYDRNDMTGKLIIGNDEVEALEIERLEWKPLITILGACETQVIHGTHLNTANIFLGSGVVSVLGTFFPVHAFHTCSFISSLMRHLVNSMIGVAPENFIKWDDIILMTQRTHYLLDAVHALETYMTSHGEKIGDYIENPMKEFFMYCEKNRINVIDWYRNRDKIFLEVFRGKPHLYKAYKTIIKNDWIIPSSLFFTSLGSPEKIIIQREKGIMSLEKVIEIYMKKILEDDN
jgi:hypothetical protein